MDFQEQLRQYRSQAAKRFKRIENECADGDTGTTPTPGDVENIQPKLEESRSHGGSQMWDNDSSVTYTVGEWPTPISPITSPATGASSSSTANAWRASSSTVMPLGPTRTPEQVRRPAQRLAGASTADVWDVESSSSSATASPPASSRGVPSRPSSAIPMQGGDLPDMDDLDFPDAGAENDAWGAPPPRPNEQGLLEYQVPHVNAMFDVFCRGNRGLDASETGTGKTYTTIYQSILLDLEPFVICPKSVILSWMEVAESYGKPLLGIASYEQFKGCRYFASDVLESVDCPYIKKVLTQPQIGSDDDAAGPSKIEASHYFEFDFPPNAFIIFDEAHRAKNHKTSTSKLLQAASKIENKVLLLSATISDKLDCFKTFGMFFGLYDSLRGYTGWMRRQMQMRKVDHDRRGLEEVQRKLDVIHHALMPGFGHRIRISELGDLFPKNQILGRCYFLAESYEVQKLYEEIKQAFEELKVKELRATALGKIMRIRQKIEILKIPIFVEQAEKYLDEGHSVAIFVNFTETLEQLQHKLQCDLCIHGQQSLEDRRSAISAFQKNKGRVIICNLKAGGVGLSLHDLKGTHPRVALFNPTWSGQDMVQGFGRIHRAGGKSPARQFLLYVGDTYEVAICKLINDKIRNLQAINDGDLVGRDLPEETIREMDNMLANTVDAAATAASNIPAKPKRAGKKRKVPELDADWDSF